MSSRSVVFGGSRSLPSSASGLVGRVVRAALARGFSVRVGCAPACDSVVVGAALAAGAASRLSVFAVGSSCGAGFPRSVVPASVSSARAAGASVSWLAGGALPVPLRARLALRSAACVAGACVGVWFVSSARQRSGSLLAASRLAAAGGSVFVFCVGFAPSQLPPLPSVAGAWQPASLAGVPCLRWQPAQPALF